MPWMAPIVLGFGRDLRLFWDSNSRPPDWEALTTAQGSLRFPGM